MFSRRTFLAGASCLASAATASAALPSVSLAASERRFLFVLARGGWDATRVFAPSAHDRVGQLSGLTWRRSAATPSVDRFFEDNAHQTILFNGLRTGSLAHTAGLRAALTGAVSADATSWASRIAGARSLDLSGDLAGPVGQPRTRRAADAASKPGGHPLGGDKVGHDESDARWDAAALLAAADVGDRQLLRATAALSAGDALAATVAWPNLPAAWDTHSASDVRQDLLFDGLFAALGQSRAALRAAGRADDTVIVVLSELGRAPKLNSRAGRDHWPFTSALVIGGGVAGGRVLGGYDADLRGLPVDAETGAVTAHGAPLSHDALGQGLLALAGQPARGGVALV